ncbi:Tn3 family transposase [Streptosporangium sandarakinum]|uniref:Tn3 family transposase n=1 Tax=Streptosporangium sandarakinum TaxID=1260955 RepID=UPI003F4D3312
MRPGVRHKLARDICHGKKGTIHQAYRDGTEDQPGSLGLVLDAAALWRPRYIDAAVVRLRAEGHEIRDEMAEICARFGLGTARRLTPLTTGPMNRNRRLDTMSGSVVVKAITDADAAQSVFQHRVTSALAEGVCGPPPAAPAVRTDSPPERTGNPTLPLTRRHHDPSQEQHATHQRS